MCGLQLQEPEQIQISRYASPFRNVRFCLKRYKGFFGDSSLQGAAQGFS